MTVESTIEYDGMMDYKISLVSKNAISFEDIQLNIPMENAAEGRRSNSVVKNGFSKRWNIHTSSRAKGSERL